MPKHVKNTAMDFGKRLATLRKAAGYTQQELADAVGVTRRMIAYYEGETKYPATALLPVFSRALGVSADKLLGITPTAEVTKVNRRLQHRLQRFDQLSKRDQEGLLRTIDVFLRKAS